MPTFSTVRAALLPLGFLLLAAGACTDLNETVYDEITDTNFKPGEKDLGSLVAPAYRALADMYMGWYGIVDVAQEEPADEIGRDTSELQSRRDLVCRLLLEKKKKKKRQKV